MVTDTASRQAILDEIARLKPWSSVVDDHIPDEAATMVAGVIVRRLERAGVRGWTLDEHAYPVPAPADLKHLVVTAKKTSPSGKALFSCARCGAGKRLTTLPPSGACSGFSGAIAQGDIAGVLLEGGRYDVDAKGLPFPAHKH